MEEYKFGKNYYHKGETMFYFQHWIVENDEQSYGELEGSHEEFFDYLQALDYFMSFTHDDMDNEENSEEWISFLICKLERDEDGQDVSQPWEGEDFDSVNLELREETDEIVGYLYRIVTARKKYFSVEHFDSLEKAQKVYDETIELRKANYKYIPYGYEPLQDCMSLEKHAILKYEHGTYHKIVEVLHQERF